MVRLLLSYSASTDIPTDSGLLAKYNIQTIPFQGNKSNIYYQLRDMAKTKEISDMITKFKGPYKRKLNEADVVSISQMKQKKLIIFFDYEVDSLLVKALDEGFNLKIAKVFR